MGRTAVPSRHSSFAVLNRPPRRA